MMRKPKLHIHVRNGAHFLRWELAEYAKHFDLVSSPSSDSLLHGYATDALFDLHLMPARGRSAYILPGWIPSSPYFDEAVRIEISRYIDRHLDVAFVTRGPDSMVFGGHPKVELTRYTIDVEGMSHRFRPRRDLSSLIHVSADVPKKDWRRSEAIMKLSGLRFEVFPPRADDGASGAVRRSTRAKRRVNGVARRFGSAPPFNVPANKYVEHDQVLRRIQEADGFVHVAVPVPPDVDGMYVSTLVEAGLTGSLIFWHDTHQCGGYLDSVFELPSDPPQAAEAIRDIAASVDVPKHSQATHDEIRDVYDPTTAVRERCRRLLESL